MIGNGGQIFHEPFNSSFNFSLSQVVLKRDFYPENFPSFIAFSFYILGFNWDKVFALV